MKSAMLSLIAVTTALGIVSAWNVQIYDSEITDCGQSPLDDPKFQYASYQGSGAQLGLCIEAGAPPPNSSIECQWFVEGGDKSEPCTGPMNPAGGGSVMIGDQTQCILYFEGTGKGIDGCIDRKTQGLNNLLSSNCTMGVQDPTQSVYFRCLDDTKTKEPRSD